jgi:hypothetical protein
LEDIIEYLKAPGDYGTARGGHKHLGIVATWVSGIPLIVLCASVLVDLHEGVTYMDVVEGEGPAHSLGVVADIVGSDGVSYDTVLIERVEHIVFAVERRVAAWD